MSAETVSVMFTDLVGSTETLVRVGEAQMEALRQDLFAVLRTAASAHEGVEVKNLGDGLMLVFPSASDLVEGAVAVQQRLERRNRAAPDPLTVRIGLATGDADHVEGDYFGVAVVEAARLCAAANASQILATDAVHLLSRQRTDHEFVALGERALKGFSDPVSVHEVRWNALPALHTSIPLPVRLQSDGSVPLIGRRQQLAQLGGELKQASASGHQGIVLISGEPGVGKTSLSAAFARAVHDDEVSVLYGRCDEDVRLPYQPWIEALDHLVTHVDENLLQEHLAAHQGDLGPLVPALQTRLGELPPARSSDLDVGRHLLFEAVAHLLARASDAAPVLVVLDDLHWADRSTLGLLKHLVGCEVPARLLIVGTYRDSDVALGHPLSELLSQLHREQRINRIALRGLDDLELAALMEAAAGHDLDEDGLALRDALVEETNGNPFFAIELLRHLAESGAIVSGDDGRWHAAAPIDATGLPVSVREVVGHRVARLGDDTHRILSAASVIGREFDLGLLTEVVQADEDSLLDMLEQAVESAVLVEVPAAGDRYQFAHSLTQRTLYSDLSAARRRRLHRRVAEALERPGDHLDERVDDLAHHWAAATQPAETDKAVEWSLRAGDKALRQLAPDEAVLWYAQALEMTDRVRHEGVRAPCLVKLGIAQRWAAQPEFRTTLLEAARLAHEHGELDLLVEASLANFRGFFSNAGSADLERIELLEVALASVGDDRAELRARLLAHLAVECSFLPDRDTASILQEAQELSTAAADPVTRLEVLIALAVFYIPQSLALRLRTLDELRSISRHDSDPARRFWALAAEVPTHAQTGNIESLRSVTDELEAAADRLGDGAMRWFAALNRQMLVLLSGDLAETEHLNRETLAVGSAAGQPDALMVAGLVQCWAELRRGDVQSATVEGLAELSRSQLDMPVARALLAEAHAQTGRADESRAILDDFLASNLLARTPDPLWATAVHVLTFSAVRIGHEPMLEALRTAAETLRGQIVYSGATIHASGEFIAAWTSASLGRWDEAETDWARALEISASLGERYFVALIAVEWARMLERSGLDPTRRRIDELARRALDAAQPFGYAEIEAEAQRLLALE